MINLFVSRLDYTVTREDLTALFKPYGFVRKVTIVTDKETGKSKGFGFIEIDSDDAQRIIDELDGHSLNNRSISVKIAEDQGPRGTAGPRNPSERKSNPSFSRRPAPQESTAPNRTLDDDEDDAPSDNVLPLVFPDASTKSKKRKGKKEHIKNFNDGPKKGKMQAYKKSGKSNRFFVGDDDEDDDFELEY